MADYGFTTINIVHNENERSGDVSLRRRNIMKFVYLATTYSCSAYNFDIFSKVCENVRLIDFIICGATIGLSYMCMDCFIKQYTGRYDCNRYMNPLLRGISYGRFLQTCLFIILHATYLADSIKFLIVSFRGVPPWSTCHRVNNSNCIPTMDIILRCNQNTTTDFTTTAAYLHYYNVFGALDRNTLTVRFFTLGLVWMLVFFFASVTEETIMKIFKLTFMCRSFSTVVAMSFVVVSTNNVATEAFSEIMDISSPSEFMLSIKHVSYACGIGFLGLHDFGAISPFTMVDTASVIFVIAFTAMAFVRSWLVKILFLVMKRCVDVDKQYGIHVLFYAILPLTTDFLYAQKLFLIYIYGNLMLSTLLFMTNQLYMVAKFLSYQFTSIKQIYLIGILCCLGFALSVLLVSLMTQVHQLKSLTAGIDVTVPYVGSVYVAIVMWMYGLQKFCTDIHFWLGFRPTRFWIISWALLPVVLFCCAIRGAYLLVHREHSLIKWSAIGWACFTVLFVAVMNIHTVSGFLMRNHLAGVFQSHKKYGPPDNEDRRRRLYFTEFTRLRKCKHKCLTLDEWIACDHQDLTLHEEISSSSSNNSRTSTIGIYNSNSSTDVGANKQVPATS